MLAMGGSEKTIPPLPPPCVEDAEEPPYVTDGGVEDGEDFAKIGGADDAHDAVEDVAALADLWTRVRTRSRFFTVSVATRRTGRS